jgi:Ferritin-like domain
MSHNPHTSGSDEANFAQPLYTPIKRRSFFMYAGATAGATALVLAGCKKDDETTPTNNGISLGAGDPGVLNYAYALEQLEAAFYAQVKSTTPVGGTGLSQVEKDYFNEVAAHEALHRDFFKAAITRDAGVANLLQNLTPDFSSIDFTQRTTVAGSGKLGVLNAAMAFEDLGVAAYNGAGRLIKTAAYLVIAGQIVSVEARHAAYVRDLIQNGTFSDTADANGLDQAMTPAMVLTAAQPFIKEKLDGSKVGV